MRGKTVLLQAVNKLFALTPLTSCYGLRARLLRIAGIQCHPTARIVASAQIVQASAVIGAESFVGHQTLLVGPEDSPIIVGRHCDIGPRVLLVSGSHEVDMRGEHSAGSGLRGGGGINIEDGVWIGAGSIVITGVTIGRKAVVGAGSVVVRDIPPFTVAVGNPCRPIKRWNSERQAFERL